MKTERRQELRANDLGAFLVDAGDWVKSHVQTIGTAALVLVVVIVGTSALRSSRQSAASSAWESLSALSLAAEDADESFAAMDGLIAGSSDRNFRMQALLLKGSNAMRLALRSEKAEVCPERFKKACSKTQLKSSRGDRFKSITDQFKHR